MVIPRFQACWGKNATQPNGMVAQTFLTTMKCVQSDGQMAILVGILEKIATTIMVKTQYLYKDYILSVGAQ